ncbi:Hypothetical predicted protein [Pelobates cultripes]|uniref:Uncharacterized protein n=1 Tax=Pelobates cultripes TaxID=61616 RepID=A0AAD1TG78_PELCU|nr:Hypothetical predicted protein [Pelobates cultripes]
MDDSTPPVPAIAKMATNTAHTTNVTTKMATASSKTTSTGFKTMTYNPHMPLEMAEGLPPSAGLIIQLIQDLRVDFKNDLKKDFDNMYGILEKIGQRTEDVEHRMSTQESFHLELVKTVSDLQKQVNQQAERIADSEDRSRRNNVRIRGIPDTVDTSELLHYFQTMV